jgi:hypothetical protein
MPVTSRRPTAAPFGSRLGLAALVLPILAAAGCTGAPDMSALTKAGLPSGHAEQLTQSTSETYARIARGANKCWFGGQGRYAQSHVLYAELAPPTNGGEAEVVIHERDRASERPWGARAFRIVLTGGSSSTAIDTENFRMPDGDAERMRREVHRWASGSTDCDAPASGSPPATTAVSR